MSKPSPHPSATPPEPRQTARRAVTGSITTAGGNLAGFLIRFATNIIFARQILPAEYGTYGFALVYASLTAIPFALSFPQAVVQLGPEHRRLFGTVRRMSLMLSAALLPLFALVALVLGEVHGSTVAHCFIGLALGQVVASLTTVYESLLHRAMRYHFVAFVRVLSIGSSIALTLPLVFTTPGPFVLVLRDTLPPVISLVAIALYLRRHATAPDLDTNAGFDRKTARAVWQLGKALFVNRAFEIAVNRLDSFAVGHVLGDEALGHFDQAKYVAGLPNAAINPLTQSVALRTFAAVRDDPPRLARAFHLVQWAVARIGAVFAIGCIAAPELVIGLVYGPGWDLAADMLRMLGPWVIAVPLIASQHTWFTAVHDFAPIRWAFVANALVLPLGLAPALLLNDPSLAPLGNSLAYVAMVIVLGRALTGRGIAVWSNLFPPMAALSLAGGAALFVRFFVLAPTLAPMTAAMISLISALSVFVVQLFAFEGRAIAIELRYLKDIIRRRT